MENKDNKEPKLEQEPKLDQDRGGQERVSSELNSSADTQTAESQSSTDLQSLAGIESEGKQQAIETLEAIDQTGSILTEAAEPAGSNVEKHDGQADMTNLQRDQQQASGTSKVWPIISLILAAALIVVLVLPFGGNKDTIATVNNTKITKDDLYQELIKTTGKQQVQQTLENMITRELIVQEAAKQDVVITEEDINAELEIYITSFGSQEILEQMLQQYGMTMDDLRQDAEFNAMLLKLLEPKTNVTDEEVKETFETYQESFNTPEQVRASVILVETEQEAKDIISQLKEGEDFAELAKNKSLDWNTKELGGDTGFFARGEVESALEEAAFKLAKDEISDPIQTSDGFYQVIKLTDRKEAHTATFEEKEAEIRKGLVTQQINELYPSWMEEIREKAKITNMFAEQAVDSTDEAVAQ